MNNELKSCKTCANNGRLNWGCDGNCVELNGINTWSDWKCKKSYGGTLIISAFPACGKSTMFRNQNELSILDSDSSNFSWEKDSDGNNINVRNSNFPKNYIDYIKNNIGKVDIILVSSHESVRKALIDSKLQFICMYPSLELKGEWIRRFKERGNDEKFIKFISENFDKFIKELDELEIEDNLRYKIKNKEYVMNEDDFKIYYDNSMGNLSYVYLNY